MGFWYRGALKVQVFTEYLLIWDLVDSMVLDLAVDDQHLWTLSTSGKYSSKSACGFFSQTRSYLHHGNASGKVGPRYIASSSFCLVYRWWTADRLLREVWHTRQPVPFVTIQHILVSCVFSRQVWAVIFQRLGLFDQAPQPSVSHFSSWWCNAINGLPKVLGKGLNTLIILVVWEVWKHRNSVF